MGFIMLCQFTFKNFKSYKDETVFDMQAINLNEFKDSLLSFEKDSRAFLPVSVFYGPNGGGKSNILQALAFLVALIIRPIKLSANYQGPPTPYMPCSPFAFDDTSENEPSEFEIFIRSKEQEYRYNVSVFERNIVEEYLYRKAIGGKRTAMLFERVGGEITLGSTLSRKNVNLQINQQMPFLSSLAINYKIDAIYDIIHWFDTCTYNQYNAFRINFMAPGSLETNETFIKILNEMDINIDAIRIKDDKDFEIFTQRNRSGKIKELHLQDESSGTVRLFELIPIVILSISQGGLLIVDEMDAHLHPKLLRYLIRLYKNPQINKNGAQLIFTSHDLSTMKNDLFRRDEIWFAAKNNEDASEIYSLYDIKTETNERVKATTAFDKQYLEGRYGADPYLSEIHSSI